MSPNTIQTLNLCEENGSRKNITNRYFASINAIYMLNNHIKKVSLLPILSFVIMFKFHNKDVVEYAFKVSITMKSDQHVKDSVSDIILATCLC